MSNDLFIGAPPITDPGPITVTNIPVELSFRILELPVSTMNKLPGVSPQIVVGVFNFEIVPGRFPEFIPPPNPDPAIVLTVLPVILLTRSLETSVK